MGVVLQHPEADGVLAANRLLLGIDADVEVVEEQIVVGAVGTPGAAQDVGPGGLSRRRWRLRAWSPVAGETGRDVIVGSAGRAFAELRLSA